MSAEEEAKAAREAARESLYRLVERDAHFTGGIMAAWLARNLPLDQLAELLEQLDRGVPEQWTDPGSGS